MRTLVPSFVMPRDANLPRAPLFSGALLPVAQPCRCGVRVSPAGRAPAPSMDRVARLVRKFRGRRVHRFGLRGEQLYFRPRKQ